MVEAFMYVYTGQYGDIDKIGLGNSALIVMQLTFSGFLIVMIDEMMNKVKLLNQRDMDSEVLFLCTLPLTFVKPLFGTHFHP